MHVVKYAKKESNKIFSTWHQDFPCKGKCWCWLEVDAEDSLVTLKVTTFKLMFLGNCWSPQQGAGTLQSFVRNSD